MIARHDLHRSVAGMALDVQRRVERRKTAGDDYKAAERESQFQFDLSGAVGSVPIEETFDLYFDVLFLDDSGMYRESQLAQPNFRYGFERTVGPSGLILYAHVSEWHRDANLQYKGAKVILGAHLLTSTWYGPIPTDQRQWAGVFHASFQGYGVPLDNADELALS